MNKGSIAYKLEAVVAVANLVFAIMTLVNQISFYPYASSSMDIYISIVYLIPSLVYAWLLASNLHPNLKVNERILLKVTAILTVICLLPAISLLPFALFGMGSSIYVFLTGELEFLLSLMKFFIFLPGLYPIFIIIGGLITQNNPSKGMHFLKTTSVISMVFAVPLLLLPDKNNLTGYFQNYEIAVLYLSQLSSYTPIALSTFVLYRICGYYLKNNLVAAK